MKTFETFLYALIIVTFLLLAVSFGYLSQEFWREAHAGGYSFDISVGLALFQIPLVVFLASFFWFVYAFIQKWPLSGVLKIYLKSALIIASLAVVAMFVINTVSKVITLAF